MNNIDIHKISEAESHYHQTLNNQAGTWGIFWFDGEFGRAKGGFSTSTEAREWWLEHNQGGE